MERRPDRRELMIVSIVLVSISTSADALRQLFTSLGLLDENRFVLPSAVAAIGRVGSWLNALALGTAADCDEHRPALSIDERRAQLHQSRERMDDSLGLTTPAEEIGGEAQD